MLSKAEIFRQLHFSDEPLLLGNVWNVSGAKVFEKAGIKAIGTSSAAIAHSLGYDDGETIPFEEHLYVIERIAKNVAIPLSVDLESGYAADAYSIFQNIKKLHNLGVAGINIEDSKVVNSVREMVDKEIFAERLSEIQQHLNASGIDIFINVRCDAFLLKLPDALEEAKRRIRLLEKLKVDGIFLPGLVRISDIREISRFTALPVNIMSVPGLPGIDILRSLNVKRISTGNFLQEHVYDYLEKTVQEILTTKNFSILFK